jgi:hypothetical protein
VADVPALDELGDRADRLLDRDVRVDASRPRGVHVIGSQRVSVWLRTVILHSVAEPKLPAPDLLLWTNLSSAVLRFTSPLDAVKERRPSTKPLGKGPKPWLHATCPSHAESDASADARAFVPLAAADSSVSASVVRE